MFILIIPSIWLLVLTISVIVIGLMQVVLSGLHTYLHLRQYDGTSVVLSEQKLRKITDLEVIYIDSSTSTGMYFI